MKPDFYGGLGDGTVRFVVRGLGETAAIRIGGPSVTTATVGSDVTHTVYLHEQEIVKATNALLDLLETGMEVRSTTSLTVVPKEY